MLQIRSMPRPACRRYVAASTRCTLPELRARSLAPMHRAKTWLVLLMQAAVLAGAAAADDASDGCQSDAMIVFDASGSMATSDYSLRTPRITHLKQAMARVLPEVAPFRRLGLIVYGEGAYNDCGSIALRMHPTPDAAEPMLRIIQGIS